MMPIEHRIKETIRQDATATKAYTRWLQENDNSAYAGTLVPLLTQRIGVGLHGPTINDVHAALSDLRARGWSPDG